MFLAQLFAAEAGRRKAQRALDACSDDIEAARERKQTHDADVAAKHREVRQHFREITTLEKALFDGEKRVDRQQPVCIGGRRQVEHSREKIDTTRKVYNAAIRKAEEHESNIEEAQLKLDDARKRRAALNKQLADQLARRELTLSADQLDEYRRLKVAADNETTIVTSTLHNLQQAQQSDRDIVEHETRRRAQIAERVREKEAECERERRIIDSMRENIERTERQIELENAQLKKAEDEVGAFKEEHKHLNEQLNDVARRLADSQGDNNETRREQARREALENLKRLFPDKVFGRLVELAGPSHKKCQIAVTKILQKHMNSIVCDSEDTAGRCIAYLRSQRHQAET